MRRTWRTWSSITVLALALTGMFALAAPTTATAATQSLGSQRICPAVYPVPAWCNAPIPRYRLANANHIGWTYLNLNYCAPGMMCAAVYRSSMPAWSWGGKGWSPATLPGGWVYTYPYTGEWRWAWTQDTGWVAVNSGRFELR